MTHTVLTNQARRAVTSLALSLLVVWANPVRAADDDKAEAPEKKAPVINHRDTFKSPQVQTINNLIAEQWAANEVKPSQLTNDFEFCRRLYLDILGRIPTATEVKAFYNDRGPSKRGRLIQKLLNDPDYAEEFASNWADIWSIWLMSRGTNGVYREQLKVWLEDHFAQEKPSHKKMVTELLTATGMNNDNGAVNFLLSHLGEKMQNTSEDGAFDAVPITSRVTRLFLGVQLQCAQCHDHPFNPDVQQKHFWGVNAFFRQIRREGTPAMANNNNQAMIASKLGLVDEPDYNSSQLVSFEKRSGLFEMTKPGFLPDIWSDEETRLQKYIPRGSKKTRRELLAEFVTGHDNFSKAYVNRMWGHFFGRGLNERPTVDDFNEENQVVHGELLDSLSKDFSGYANYNVKELITWICNSDPYQLTCVANKTNEGQEKEVLFARMLLKAMSPEQLFESLMYATNPPPKRGKKADASSAALLDARKKLREQWMSKLVRNFGDDEGNEITFNGTVIQALLMMNGKDLNDELTKKEGNAVSQAIKLAKNPALYSEKVVDELFLMALSRPASKAETYHLKMVIVGKGPTVGDDDNKPTRRPVRGRPQPPQPVKKPQWSDQPKSPEEFAEQFYQDVFWALLNTNEFILNH